MHSYFGGAHHVPRARASGMHLVRILLCSPGGNFLNSMTMLFMAPVIVLIMMSFAMHLHLMAALHAWGPAACEGETCILDPSWCANATLTVGPNTPALNALATALLAHTRPAADELTELIGNHAAMFATDLEAAIERYLHVFALLATVITLGMLNAPEP